MRIPFYQIDAFAAKVFSGNPAGVCLLEEWLPDKNLQSIAAENNLPETAFLLKADGHYEIRWFTPEVEVDLCGHATLASGHVVFEFVEPKANRIEFQSQSGKLAVERKNELLILDFPARKAKPCPAPPNVDSLFGASPSDVLSFRDLMLVFDNEEVVRRADPDMATLSQLDCFGIIITAPGKTCDFVSRFFAPKEGIPEDPVTGSAHCTLVPYWAEKLGKQKLHARQISLRGGELFCEDLRERVSIGGRAVTYLCGTITV